MVMVGDVWRMYGKDWEVVGRLKSCNGPTMFELMEVTGRGGLLGRYLQFSSAAYISTYGVLVKRPGVTQAVMPPDVAERRRERKQTAAVLSVISGVLENVTVTQIPHTAAELIVEALTSAGYGITTLPTSRPATSPSTPPPPPRPRRSRPRRPS